VAAGVHAPRHMKAAAAGRTIVSPLRWRPGPLPSLARRAAPGILNAVDGLTLPPGSPLQIFTAEERPDLWARASNGFRDNWPECNMHGNQTGEYFGELVPRCQPPFDILTHNVRPHVAPGPRRRWRRGRPTVRGAGSSGGKGCPGSERRGRKAAGKHGWHARLLRWAAVYNWPDTGPDGRSQYGMLETLRAYGTRLLAGAGEQQEAAGALAAGSWAARSYLGIAGCAVAGQAMGYTRLLRSSAAGCLGA
jgi:hypothetical protein